MISLSINSPICVNFVPFYGFIFLLIEGHILLLLCLTSNFRWDADFASFTLLSAAYLYIFKNILELCSEGQLRLWWRVYSFQGFISGFVRWNQNCLQSRINLAPQPSALLSTPLPNSPIAKLLHAGQENSFFTCASLWVVLSSLPGSFSLASKSFFRCMHLSVGTWREPRADL